MQKLHDSIRKDLVHKVFLWTHLLAIILGSVATIALFLDESADNFIFPLSAVIVIACSALSTKFGTSDETAVSMSLGFLCLNIFCEALTKDCTASLVPALYGIVPCLSGFLHRTQRAVVLSAVFVSILLFIITAADLSGYCTDADSCSKASPGVIIGDRLVPMFAMIVINSVSIAKILEHSQESLKRHVEAAHESAKLATATGCAAATGTRAPDAPQRHGGKRGFVDRLAGHD